MNFLPIGRFFKKYKFQIFFILFFVCGVFINTATAKADCSDSTFQSLIGLRVDIQDSTNCGGSNPNIQNVSNSKSIDTTNCRGVVTVTVSGKVERQNAPFDYVALNGLPAFNANEEHLGCQAIQKTADINITINYAPTTTFVLNYNTVDGQYQIGQYAEITGVKFTKTGCDSAADCVPESNFSYCSVGADSGSGKCPSCSGQTCTAGPFLTFDTNNYLIEETDTYNCTNNRVCQFFSDLKPIPCDPTKNRDDGTNPACDKDSDGNPTKKTSCGGKENNTLSATISTCDSVSKKCKSKDLPNVICPDLALTYTCATRCDADHTLTPGGPCAPGCHSQQTGAPACAGCCPPDQGDPTDFSAASTSGWHAYGVISGHSCDTNADGTSMCVANSLDPFNPDDIPGVDNSIKRTDCGPLVIRSDFKCLANNVSQLTEANRCTTARVVVGGVVQDAQGYDCTHKAVIGAAEQCVGQTSSFDYCVGTVLYTLTATSNGQCINNPSAHCDAPIVNVQCQGVNAMCGGGIGNNNNNNNNNGPITNLTHLACVNKKCVQQDGPGSDGCKVDSDCTATSHNECNASRQCASVAGPGASQCKTTPDCLANNHNECNASRQCVSVVGPGNSACAIGDPNICGTTSTHTECNNQKQCVLVNSAGKNLCTINPDNCSTASHLVCNNQKQCVVVNGAGADACSPNGNECVNTHNVCNSSKQCVNVIGVGTDNCFYDSACGAATHVECNTGKQCVIISSTGKNLCSGNSDCSATHNVCNSQNQCEVNYSQGTDACYAANDCKTIIAPTVTNLKVVPGPYCSGIRGAGTLNFEWTYGSDSNNDPETQYELQVSTTPDFTTGLIADRTISFLNEPNGHTDILPFYVTSTACSSIFTCDRINYNTAYYWRVKVWAAGNITDSGFVPYASNPYTFIYPHPAPDIFSSVTNYDLVKDFPTPGDTINFTDSDSNGPSMCYGVSTNDGSIKTFSCACLCLASQDTSKCPVTAANCPTDINYSYWGHWYIWDFGNGGDVGDLASIKDVESPTYYYQKPSTYTTRLSVCDDVSQQLGECCSATLPVSVRSNNINGLPNWKEMAPAK